MRNSDFEELLRKIKLPMGVLLADGKTFRIEEPLFHLFGKTAVKELTNFEKFLVLSDGKLNVVGGVLFYGNTDLQVTIFPEYRGSHYMSSIHKNGILMSECYEGQRVSLEVREIDTMDDFLLRIHMLKYVGIPVKNLSEIYKHLKFFRVPELDGVDEDTFVREYS